MAAYINMLSPLVCVLLNIRVPRKVTHMSEMMFMGPCVKNNLVFCSTGDCKFSLKEVLEDNAHLVATSHKRLQKSILSWQWSHHESYFANYLHNFQDLCKADCKSNAMQTPPPLKKTHHVKIFHAFLTRWSITLDCGWCQMFPWGPEAVVTFPCADFSALNVHITVTVTTLCGFKSRSGVSRNSSSGVNLCWRVIQL